MGGGFSDQPADRFVPFGALRAARLSLVGLGRARPWLGTLARLGLGSAFLIAGALKIGDLAASGRAVAAYRLMPYDVAAAVGAAQPFVELALGALLVLGIATRFSAIIASVLLVAFLIGIGSAWARGLRIDCGCFSQGGDLTGDQQPHYAWEVVRDIALLLVAGFLVAFPRTRYSVDERLDGGTR
jgi:uncharacterized membrane protein YphA (DoxX/SURF4 family)